MMCKISGVSLEFTECQIYEIIVKLATFPNLHYLKQGEKFQHQMCITNKDTTELQVVK